MYIYISKYTVYIKEKICGCVVSGCDGDGIIMAMNNYDY